jgi:hypothetical protein
MSGSAAAISGSGTKKSIPTKRKNVSALTVKSTVKLDESAVVAIRPPRSPPRPIPRLRVTRCRAKAPWRRACEVRPARSADWLGQKPAFPTPATIAARTPCQGSWTSGKLPQPIA